MQAWQVHGRVGSLSEGEEDLAPHSSELLVPSGGPWLEVLFPRLSPLCACLSLCPQSPFS